MKKMEMIKSFGFEVAIDDDGSLAIFLSSC
jgi:hypothetical protein